MKLWDKLADFWVANKKLSAILIIAVFGLGSFTYINLIPRDGLPELELPIVIVGIDHDARTPLEADELIGAKTNDALMTIDGVAQIQTRNSAENTTSVVFTEASADTTALTTAIKDKLKNSGIEADISLASFDTKGLTVTLSSNEFTANELDDFTRQLAENLKKNEIVGDSFAITQYNDEGELTSYSHEITIDNNGKQVKKNVTSIALNKLKDTDSITFSKEVNQELADLQDSGTIPSHVGVNSIDDDAVKTNEQIAGLESSLIQSLAVVGLVVLIFVSWRASVVSMIFIPTVMAATILILYLLGATLNTISMFGLLLVLGLFIDDIIVIVEAIDNENKNGTKGTQSVKNALSKIGAADILGSLTTIAVFIPLMFISGLMGDFIRQLPLAVVIALAVSVAFALTGFLSFTSTMLAGKQDSPIDKFFRPFSKIGDVIINIVKGTAEKFVGSYLKGKIRTLFAALLGIVLIIAGLITTTGLTIDFFPAQQNLTQIELSASIENATSLEAAESTAQNTVNQLVSSADNNIKTLTVFDTDTYEFAVQIDLSDDRTMDAPELTDKLLDAFEDNTLVSIRSGSQSSGGDDATDYRFSASSYEDLAVLENTAAQFMNGIEGVDAAIALPTNTVLERWDEEPVVIVRTTFAADVDTAAINNTLGEKAEKDGLGVNFEADQVAFLTVLEQDQTDTFGSMGSIFLISILVVSILLAIQFRSILLPGLILLAIPLALPLLFPGLLGVGADLSFFTMLGIAALVGIAVNNSIMLIDYANREIRGGARPIPAIMSALDARIRPLVATTLTTVIGVFPLTKDLQFSGLAWTIIFGMLSSTLLVIMIFPAYYVMLQTPRSAVSGFIDRKFRKNKKSA